MDPGGSLSEEFSAVDCRTTEEFSSGGEGLLKGACLVLVTFLLQAKDDFSEAYNVFDKILTRIMLSTSLALRPSFSQPAAKL